MTLQAQEIEVPLNLGMATKPSAELAEPTHMRLVQNLHWRGLGELEKRPADDTSVVVTAPSGGHYEVDESCGLVVCDRTPLVVTGRYGVANYDEIEGAFQFARARTPAGSTPDDQLNYCPVSYDVTRRFVERSQLNLRDAGIFQVVSAQHNGVHVIAWITMGSTAYLRCKAIRVDTWEVVATSEYVSLGSSAAFMAQACEYTESGKEGVLIAYINDTASPYTVSTVRYDAGLNEFVTDSDLATNAVTQTFSITKNGARIYFAYHDSATGFLKVQDRTIGSVSSTHTASHGAVGVDVVISSGMALIVSCTTSTAYAEVFGTPSGVQTLFAASSETLYKITAAVESLSGSTNDAVAFVSSVTSSSPTSSRLRGREVNFTSTTPVLGLETVQPHCVTVANAFTLHGMAHVVLAVFTRLNGSDPVSATSCFVARYRSGGTTGSRYDAVAKVAHDRFYLTNYLTFDPANPGLGKQGTSVYVDSADNAWLALTADPSAATAYAAYRFPQSIFIARVSAARPMPMPYASPEPGVVIVAGGMPWEYDGDFPAELTALVPPRVVVDVSAGTGQTMATGFSVRAVYEWVDARGRLKRMPGPLVASGAFTNKQIDVYVSRCPMRSYNDTSLGDMEPKIYLTEDGGSSYYLSLDGSGNVDTHDSTTTDGNWYKFSAVLPASTSAPPWPMSNLEIEPEPTPGFAHVSRISDRMWAVDAEDRGRIWFSKPLVSGFGVEWATACTLTFGGEAVAVLDVGGYPTIFARDGLYQIAGPGPDALGNGSFSPAQRMPFEVDCLDPVSVCRTPLGVAFRGRRGLYVAGNGVSAEPFLLTDPDMLASPAQDESLRLRVVFQEQTNEIQCVTPSGERLVYNIVEKKWSKYVQTTALVTTATADMVVTRARHWRLDRVDNTSDYLRSEELFSDVGESYNSSTAGCEMDTPWYRLDGAAGMVRLWRAWFVLRLPDLTSDITDMSAITVRYYVNNNDTEVQNVSWSGAEIDDYYNASSTERVVRLPFVPRLQLVHSFRFAIECAFSGASPGPRPMAMRLQFGVRPGMRGKRNPVNVKG